MKTIVYDDYNSQIMREVEVIGMLTVQIGNKAFSHGWKLIEVYESDKSTKEIDKKNDKRRKI